MALLRIVLPHRRATINAVRKLGYGRAGQPYTRRADLFSNSHPDCLVVVRRWHTEPETLYVNAPRGKKQWHRGRWMEMRIRNSVHIVIDRYISSRSLVSESEKIFARERADIDRYRGISRDIAARGNNTSEFWWISSGIDDLLPRSR